MRFVGYEFDGLRRIGVVDGDDVIDCGTVQSFYEKGTTSQPSATDGAVRIRREGLVPAPPVPTDARVYCVGINYHAHGDEARAITGLDTPSLPMVFGRWADTLCSDGDKVPRPQTEGLDWEVELAIVIGAHLSSPDDADRSDAVFGYTAFNDLSARRKQLQTPQFTLGKNTPRSAPIGPCIVSADEIEDPYAVRLQTRVNGELVQDDTTANMIHRIPAILRHILEACTAKPGDVIATGTPAGVGLAQSPPRYLGVGDTVAVWVEGIGSLTNEIVAPLRRARDHS